MNDITRSGTINSSCVTQVDNKEIRDNNTLCVLLESTDVTHEKSSINVICESDRNSQNF